MPYNTGTATDYIDMLDQLIEVVTSRPMITVAVNTAGTNHAIGDVIDITVGASVSTHVAQIEVVTLSGSTIATARIFRAGAYTTLPTLNNNAQSATTGSGTGATFDITFEAAGLWTELQRNVEAASGSATVDDGGSGYTSGDVLTAAGGVLAEGGAAATFSTTIGSGAVTAAVMVTPGEYEVFPVSPFDTTAAPTGGTGCQLTHTTVETTGPTVCVLQGDAGSNVDPLIGIKTFTVANGDETGTFDIFDWALFGMTAYTSSLALWQQANISVGFGAGVNTITTAATTGAFFPLKDNAGSPGDDIQWKIRHTGRTVSIVCRVQNSSTPAYPGISFGLFNQFGTTTELPFPAYVCGASDRRRVFYKDGGSSIFTSIATVASLGTGPMFVWSSADGAWIEIKNATLGGQISTSITYSQVGTPRATLLPVGIAAVHSVSDDLITANANSNFGFDNAQLSKTIGALQIYRTPDTGGDLFPLFPLSAVQTQSAGLLYRAFGEIDGVFWVSQNDAGISSEDRFTQGAVAYSIYHNGTQSQAQNFLALEES